METAIKADPELFKLVEKATHEKLKERDTKDIK